MSYFGDCLQKFGTYGYLILHTFKIFYILKTEQWMRRNNGHVVTVCQAAELFGCGIAKGAGDHSSEDANEC